MLVIKIKFEWEGSEEKSIDEKKRKIVVKGEKAREDRGFVRRTGDHSINRLADHGTTGARLGLQSAPNMRFVLFCGCRQQQELGNVDMVYFLLLHYPVSGKYLCFRLHEVTFPFSAANTCQAVFQSAPQQVTRRSGNMPFCHSFGIYLCLLIVQICGEYASVCALHSALLWKAI